MYKVYILKSNNYNHYYVGQTSNLTRRLREHNLGKIYWTRGYKPWQMIYYELFSCKKEAILREKYFKSHAGRNWLKKNIGPRSSTDRTTPF